MMKRRLAYAFTALVLVCGALGFAQEQPRLWTARQGNTSFQFNMKLLKDLGITMDAQQTGKPFGEGHVAFTTAPASQLVFVAPRGDFETLDNGSLFHEGGFYLHLPNGETLDLTGFELRAKRFPENFELFDRYGNRWFTLNFAHTLLTPSKRSLTYRHMDMKISPELAERLGYPLLAGNYMARAYLDLVVDVPEGIDLSTVGGTCPPDTSGTTKDVAITGLGSVSYEGRADGRVAFAPGAVLENVGRESVIWNYCIAPDSPNGQHPYLVMHFYRISPDGVIEMLGQSDVKHAFFTINSACACSGGHILYPGCSDTYSASNNTSTYFLGPRAELNPYTGVWVSRGSHFDNDQDGIDECEGEGVDCDDMRSHNGESDNTHILSSVETDLMVDDARYFMEGWYIVQHDVDIWNGVGFREVNPTLQGSVWSFPYTGAFNNGSVLDAWVNPDTPGEGNGSQRIRDIDGNMQIAQTTQDLGDGYTKYVYALMNMDYYRGVGSIRLPFNAKDVRGEVTVSTPNYNPATGEPHSAEPWSATWEGSELVLTAPENGQLRWGTMLTLVFEAAGTPTNGTMTLNAAGPAEDNGTGSGTISFTMLVPGSSCFSEVLPLVPDWPQSDVRDIISNSPCLLNP